ncbi:hypothetical protein RRF57_005024 [Xylaria bambusicola]|uniref:Uncharacterized protein n=1 Tax=Xylaria bambusicola TaxID=326684 RepID=A0AAN7UP95_9PEZI
MSLSNTTVGVARSSTHFLTSTASTLARVTIPNNATPRSHISSTRSIRATTVTSVTTSQSSLTPIWFNSTNPLFDQPIQDSNSSTQPESERKVKLGRSEQRLQ